MHKVKLKQRRIFSEEFKRARVREYDTGKLKALEIAREYNISFQSVYNWIYKYSNFNKKGAIVVVEMKSQMNKNKQLVEKIKELEQIVGQKQMKIDYLEKMIELTEAELKVDIKKKAMPHPGVVPGQPIKTRMENEWFIANSRYQQARFLQAKANPASPFFAESDHH